MGFDSNLYLGHPDFAAKTSNDLFSPLPRGDRQVGSLENLFASAKGQGDGQEDPITGAEETLQQALGVAESHLANFATIADFDEKMNLTFGESRNVAAAEALEKAWETGDFSSIPGIEIRPTVEINGALGAFAGEGNKIYLSQELLEEGNVGAVANVLLEEIGHGVDWQINTTDAFGDEGAIFSAVIRGKSLSGAELQQLKTEDDSATVWLDGQLVAIEQANIGINQTINESLSNTDPENPNRLGRFSDDYSVSGVDDWQQVQVNLNSADFDAYLELVNAATGAVILSDDDSGENRNSQITFTKYPGVDYLIRATSYNQGATGSYTLKTIPLGTASSVIITDSGQIGSVDSQGRFAQIGTVTNTGSSLRFNDVALSNDDQLFILKDSRQLYSIEPESGSSSLIGNFGAGAEIRALEFLPNNVLYGAGTSNLYTIDPQSGFESPVGNFNWDSNAGGDLVFDFAKNQFLFATDGRLFSVSLTGETTYIGDIGFSDVFGLSFEGNTLVGFTGDRKRIIIDPITGAGTLDRNLTGFSGQITGATSIQPSISAIPVDPVPVPGTLEFSAPEFRINEDGTAIASVTVNRTGGSDGAVSATVNLSDGTATSDDYNNTAVVVSFAAGETQKTLNIPIVNDTVDESDETINLSLSDPIGGAAIGQQSVATLVIVADPIDNAVNPGFLEFSAPEFRVGEDGTPVKAVTVVRTGGTDGTVSVTLNLSDGSARTPDDYNNTPITVTFAPGETKQIVTVPIYNDREQEGNETINLTLSNPTGGAAIGNKNAATLVIDETARRPVLVVPGIVGSFVNPELSKEAASLDQVADILLNFTLPGLSAVQSLNPNDLQRVLFRLWNRNRGLPPEFLTIDPIANFYNPLIKTLENVGYVQGQDLFGAAYDWRLPPAPMNDGTADGHIGGLSGASITDTKYEHGVDYIGYYLKEAAEKWKERFPDAPPLDSVDVISHSTGGLVARAYVQSDAYGGSFESKTFGALTLPKIDNFIMLGVPNKGAPLAWNVLNDDWNVNFPFSSAAGGFGLQDVMFGQLIRKFANVPYQKVLKGEVINGPNPISLATLSGEPGSPQHKQSFIEQYVPTIRALSPDYDFLKNEAGDSLIVDSIDPSKKNTFLLDLNGNNGISSVAKNSHVTVIYGTDKSTPTSVVQKTEPELKKEGNIITVNNSVAVFTPSIPVETEQSFTDFRSKAPEGIWYKPELSKEGDDTVPIKSSFEPFVGEKNLSAWSLSNVGHNEIPANKEAQQRILLTLTGLEFFSKESSKQIETSGSLPNLATASVISLALDPVEGFVVDASGRRLGYSEATGAVMEIPNSVWFGDTEGFGFVFGETENPLNLELTGLGEDHYVQVSGFQDNQVVGIESSGFLAEGEQRNLGIEVTEISPDSSPDQSVASEAETLVTNANTSANAGETGTSLTNSNIPGATGETETETPISTTTSSADDDLELGNTSDENNQTVVATDNESDRSNEFKDIFGIGDQPIVI